MKRFNGLVFGALLVFSTSLFSASRASKGPKTYGNAVVSKLVKVYDGDTFTVQVDGWPEIIREVSVRVFGIDTPEMKDKDPVVKQKAQEAKEFSKGVLEAAKVIELRELQRDKYFRILAKVYVDGQNLAEMLIAANLAVSYDGGTKQNWSDVLGDADSTALALLADVASEEDEIKTEKPTLKTTTTTRKSARIAAKKNTSAQL
ncbi:thermonuclease family protein [Candidatus Babeliales bacterium]|nr:thermonuclease family protein [Candidatus Babeliales bacterium]